MGRIVGAITGLYAFLIKHVTGHADKGDIEAEIQQLKANVQYKDTCEQIVQRLDENHTETSKKLDQILEKLL